VKILEGEIKTMKEKMTLLLNKGSDDDALIDALKRELIAVKQQAPHAPSGRAVSAGKDKPAASTASASAPSAQLTSSLKSDLAKVQHCFCDSISSSVFSFPLQSLERAVKAETQVERQQKIILALKGDTFDMQFDFQDKC
jgi:hypothetical protein